MKIAIISRFDYCGSGYRMAQAINLNTKNHVQYFRLVPDGQSFGRPQPLFTPNGKEWSVSNQVIDEVNELLRGVDIIHIKGDEPPTEKYFPLLNLEKPTVISVAGSFFRRGKSRVAQPLEDISVYLENTDKRTALMADLNYPEFDSQFTPHPHDVTNTEVTWEPRKKPLIVHTPTSKKKKGTAIFLEAVKDFDVDVEVIYEQPHSVAIDAISRASIVFDQCRQESYGNVTIEATARGIPTLTQLSEKSVKWSGGLLENSPIVDTGSTVESVRDAIETILSKDQMQLSKDTRAFCERVHSYEAVAKMWDKIYKEMLCK
jgi:hypothetical protein